MHISNALLKQIDFLPCLYEEQVSKNRITGVVYDMESLVVVVQ